MPEATPIRPIHPADSGTDAITEVLRRGARRLLAAALESEVDAYLGRYGDIRDELGRRAVVRNGHLPEREVQTGIGAVPVKQPRVRVRPTGDDTEVPKFTSRILTPYLRKTRSIEELIPWLYLKETSTCGGAVTPYSEPPLQDGMGSVVPRPARARMQVESSKPAPARP